ncbi:hypothetical protein NPIL_221271 [Nephila pilipes]|uniref:Uncharacterized protein n=1 Tax=Nephila pilipes TaxID=299642 RepID=A0A8X6R473_NEPPI|nr:hypothetical protein NPIL_221271 [Nephila pilipes]
MGVHQDVSTSGWGFKNHLDRTFENNWVEYSCPVVCHSRSLDLSPLAYFFLKSIVNSEVDLVARISITIATVRETLGIYENVLQSCREGIMRVFMPMGAISNTSYDASKSYIVLF